MTLARVMYHLTITEDAKVKISSPVSQSGVSHYGEILSLLNTGDHAAGETEGNILCSETISM